MKDGTVTTGKRAVLEAQEAGQSPEVVSSSVAVAHAVKIPVAKVAVKKVDSHEHVALKAMLDSLPVAKMAKAQLSGLSRRRADLPLFVDALEEAPVVPAEPVAPSEVRS